MTGPRGPDGALLLRRLLDSLGSGVGCIFDGTGRIGGGAGCIGSGLASSGGRITCRIDRGAGGVSRSGTRVGSSVHCGTGSISSLIHRLGGLLGSPGGLFSGLAAATGEKSQGDRQRKPCLARRDSHTKVLLMLIRRLRAPP